jgi:tRNA threonylcarbamoyladenosine biosynthesis protein TsaB
VAIAAFRSLRPRRGIERGRRRFVLVLGIETSSRSGSVALVEDGRVVAAAAHDTPNAHGERLLGLIDALFEQSGRNRRELSLVAVGRGPGAFTGLRIGLALAQGIATGLGIAAVGVGSLQAMSLGLLPALGGRRYTVLDARRGELFLAGYRGDGTCTLAPCTVARNALIDALEHDLAVSPPAREDEPLCLLGAVLGELSPEEFDPSRLSLLRVRVTRTPATDYPGAIAVATAASRGGALEPATPEYLRDADAVLPNLPPSPLG